MCALDVNLRGEEEILSEAEWALLTNQRLVAALNRKNRTEITDEAELSDIVSYKKTNGGQESRMQPGLMFLGAGAVITVLQVLLRQAATIRSHRGTPVPRWRGRNTSRLLPHHRQRNANQTIHSCRVHCRWGTGHSGALSGQRPPRSRSHDKPVHQGKARHLATPRLFSMEESCEACPDVAKASLRENRILE